MSRATDRALLLIPVAVALVAAAPAFAQDGSDSDPQADVLERGRYILHAGGCITCHTVEDDAAGFLAGGRALESPFGTFYAPNITPDPDTGIGRWSDEDFLNAFWEGTNPDGDHYFPSFPYTAYTGVSRDDLLALKAYLFSVEPVVRENREHDLALLVSSRTAAGAWKRLNFDAGRFVPDPEKDDEWNRGAYLVRHLGHCGECHTPRSRTGALLPEREMAGSELGDEKIPNITPHRADGIGRWRASDIEYFLDIGMLPDGDFTGSSMVDVIEDNTSKLTRADRRAIAAYLLSLPPLPDED